VPAAGSKQPARELLRSPLWGELLDRAAEEISYAGPPSGGSGASCADDGARTLARAHAHLLVALDGHPIGGRDAGMELVGDASELMVAVAELGIPNGTPRKHRRRQLATVLAQRLSAHEHGVLAGELTYEVRAGDGDESAARLRQLMTRSSPRGRDGAESVGELRVAAAGLAALLIRAGANAPANGRADQAPEPRSEAIDATLGAIAAEIAARAQDVERPVDDRGDVVAHHLAAALRMRVLRDTLHRLADTSTAGVTDRAVVRGAREAWLRLATSEHVAISALDQPFGTPTYQERFGDLPTAIVEGAANVIYGARLAGRAWSFRHRDAWGHQGLALTYALEAYVAGLRGVAGSFAQAQLIVLTRLMRAVAAIALLDIRGAPPSAGEEAQR
jgi:hypothetical protein